jgi:hypothetical protein
MITNWNELKQKIYYVDGTLRDIYILDTNIEDNKKWVEYVNKNYLIKWFNGLKEVTEDKIVFEIVEGYLSRTHDCCSSAYVYIDDIQVNNHFFSDIEFENDIDPREITSIQHHEKLVNYMCEVSNLLSKPIILTLEGEKETILMKIMKNTIEYLA